MSRRALLVGADSNDAPIGSINDIASMFGLVLRYDIERKNVVTLVSKNRAHPLCATSEESTKLNIERNLTVLSNSCVRGDSVLVFFSGHSNIFFTDVYFECADGEWISGAYLREWAKKVTGICRATVLMDTCYAGRFYRDYFQPPFVSRFLGSLNGLFGQKGEPAKSSEDNDHATGLFFLGSSSETEKSASTEAVSNKRGIFTQAITREISLKSRNISNLVLFHDVYGRVQRQAKQKVTRIGHPKMEDLPFFHL